MFPANFLNIRIEKVWINVAVRNEIYILPNTLIIHIMKHVLKAWQKPGKL